MQDGKESWRSDCRPGCSPKNTWKRGGKEETEIEIAILGGINFPLLYLLEKYSVKAFLTLQTFWR
jgi:hypothetical protein